jgi:large subunit ribosomal protein L24
VLPKKNRVVVEGANIVKKHTRATETNPGGINEVPAPIHISNVMLADPKTGEPTRIGRKLVDGKLVRYSKKSGEIIK